jgi:hypothetical protein
MAGDRRSAVIRRSAISKDAADTMGFIQTLTASSLVYSVACIVACLALGRLCLSIILHPTRMFWRVKRRQTAPECLTDPAYGIHGYLPIEVWPFKVDFTSVSYRYFLLRRRIYET